MIFLWPSTLIFTFFYKFLPFYLLIYPSPIPNISFYLYFSSLIRLKLYYNIIEFCRKFSALVIFVSHTSLAFLLAVGTLNRFLSLYPHTCLLFDPKPISLPRAKYHNFLDIIVPRSQNYPSTVNFLVYFLIFIILTIFGLSLYRDNFP